MSKSEDGKNGPKNLVSKAQERPCLYYEVGEAGLWLSDQDSDQGPHTDCAALRCLASPGMAATASGSDSWPARQAQHLPAPGLPVPASTRPPTLISSSSGVFHSVSCLHGPQDQHLCIGVALRSCVVALDAVAALNPFAVYTVRARVFVRCTTGSSVCARCERSAVLRGSVSLFSCACRRPNPGRTLCDFACKTRD
jgi:hypothetical protein